MPKVRSIVKIAVPIVPSHSCLRRALVSLSGRNVTMNREVNRVTSRLAAPAHADDELAFLDHLESGAPVADDGPAPELAEDDLAFLEELDRAISGGAASGGGQTPPPTLARRRPSLTSESFSTGATHGMG